MRYEIDFEQEDDGRWIAEIQALPGVMVYGDSKEEAASKVEALALRVIRLPAYGLRIYRHM